MLEHFSKWWRCQDQILDLQSQSDRMLADMGIERHQIRELVSAEPKRKQKPKGLASWMPHRESGLFKVSGGKRQGSRYASRYLIKSH